MAKSRIAEAYVQLVPSMDGFGKNIQKALKGNPEIGGLGEQLTKGFDAQGKTAGAKLAKGLKVGLGAAAIGTAAGVAIVGGIVGSLATKAIQGGIQRSLNIEDAQAKLKGLGYQGEQIQAVTDNVLDAVRGTAFSLDQTMGVAATALAAGVKQGTPLTDYLKTVTDTATIAGADVGEIGSIFNKVQAAGKAYTGEIQQLQDRGLPVFTWLQEELGVTSEELQKMISNGEISSERLFASIQKNVGGAAQASGETTRGAIANTNAALARLGAVAVGGAMPILQELLQKFIPVLDTLTEKLKPIAEAFWATFGPQILEGADRLFNFILNMANGTSNLGGLFSGLFTGAAPLIELVGQLSPLGLLFQTLVSLAPQIAAAFAPLGEVLVTTLVPALGQIFTALAPVIASLAEAAGVILVALIPVIATLVESLVPVVVMLVEALAPILVMIAEMLGTILPPIIQALMPVFAFVLNTIAIAVYGLSLILYLLVNGIVDFANSFGAGWTKMPMPEPPHMVGLAKGGNVLASPGGTPVILGEGGKDETVTDLGLTNQQMANTNALALKALEGGTGNTGGDFNMNVYQQPGESTEELVKRIYEYWDFNQTAGSGGYAYG